MKWEIEEIDDREVPLCGACGRPMAAESATGVWRCGTCERDECVARWKLTRKWLEERERIGR